MGGAIREVLNDSIVLFSPYFESQNPLGDSTKDSGESEGDFGELDSEQAKTIIALIEKQIAPSLAAHGGHVRLLGVKKNRAYLQFGGGCQGCSQASVTVKQGVERLLKESLPSLLEVVDVTNHAQGSNPYFK